MMRELVLVVGTGTEIGKTRVTALLALGARLAGEETIGLKPIESGISSGQPTDSSILARASGGQHTALYQFVPPISPHRAAREAGVAIDLAVVRGWVEERARAWTWVESAGGLFSPLSHETCNCDLIRALSPTRLVLVAPGRLGVLHDVSAALLGAEAVGVGLHRGDTSLGAPWSTIVVSPVAGWAEAEAQKEELERAVLAPRGWNVPILVAPQVQGSNVEAWHEPAQRWWETAKKCFT